ncbi:MAG: O-antigen ligase family protein [Candidatus Oxydemutatoraceae bacterium WSBS_2016_MAG_OTU14]
MAKNKKKQQHANAVAQVATAPSKANESRVALKKIAFKNMPFGIRQHTRTPNWLLWGLLILIASPAIVGPYGQKGGYTPDLHMGAYIQVFASAWLAIALFSLRKSTIEIVRAPVIIPLTLLYVWAGMSVFWAHSSYEAVSTILGYTGAFLVATLVILLVKDMDWVRKIITAMVISGFLIATLGIMQFLFGVDWVQQHNVPAATFSNKNMAGQYALLTFPLAAVSIFTSKKWQETWFYVLATAFIAVFMFFTHSRAVWLSAAVECFFLLLCFIYMVGFKRVNIFDTIHKKLAIFSAVVVILSVSYLSPLMLGVIKDDQKGALGSFKESNYTIDSGWDLLGNMWEGLTYSGAVRTRIWANSIPMFIDHAFSGVGLGNWTVFHTQYQAWVQQDSHLAKNSYHANAHNDYIELFCELGIVGVILFYIFLFGLFRVIGAILFSRRLDPGDIFLLSSLMIALAGLAFDAMFSFPLKRTMQLMLVATYIALLSVIYSIHIKGIVYRINITPNARKAFGAGLSIVSIFLLVLHYNLFQSEYFFRIAAVSAQERGDKRQIIRAAKKAYEYNPIRTKLRWHEAIALLKTGYIDKGTSLMEKISSQYPYSQDTLLNLATAYISQGKYAKASEKYAELLEVQEVPPKNLLVYLRILENQGEYRTMVKEIDEALPRYSEELDSTKRGIIWYGAISVRKRQILYLNSSISLLNSMREHAKSKIAQQMN